MVEPRASTDVETPGTPVSATLDDTPIGGIPLDGDRVDLSPGTRVGRYVVLQRLGAGGMGVVYAAFDPELDRKVAIKLLQADVLDGERASRGHARLVREAKAMAQLAHPNVVAVHDVGTFGHRVFVAMEFVAGTTLTQWMQKPHTWREVVEMFVAAGRGLAAAHAQGLVHRDFKPDNALVGQDGRVRVLDFGLAARPSAPFGDLASGRPMLVEASLPEPHPPHGIDLASISERHDLPEGRLTATGALAGTPAYMAPEQYLGDRIDARTDQFSFCVALWEGLYGVRPFSGATRPALAMAVCRAKIDDPPETGDVPPRLQKILRRGLSLDPERRFASMDALLAELAHDPQRDRRRRWSMAAFIALPALAVAGAWWPTHDDPCAAGPERVAAGWNDDTRAAVRDGFTASSARYADDASRAVIDRMDAWATAWAQAHRAACEATHVRHEQSAARLDLRMTCLSDRWAAFQSTAAAFAEADARLVRRAAQAVSALPTLDDCADLDRLEVELALPEDAELAARVEALRRRGSELSMQLHLTEVADDAAIYEAYLEDVRATGYAPLLAEAHHLAGLVALATGHAEESQARLEDAVYYALASDHDRMLARALVRLAHLVGILRSRYDEGLQWAHQAEGAVLALGPDSPQATSLQDTMCKLLADKGDATEALPHCLQALEQTRARHGDDDWATAAAHESVGIAYYHAGRDDDALQEFTAARDAFARTEGESHPDLARVQNSLAAVCFAIKGAAPCVESFERAVELSTAALGPEHPQVADFSNNLALVLAEVGRVAESEARAREALRIRRALSGDDHPGVAASLRALGVAARVSGDLPGAEAYFREALPIAVATRGEGHPDVLTLHQDLGGVLDARGEHADAREHWRVALALAEALHDDEAATGARAALAANDPAEPVPSP